MQQAPLFNGIEIIITNTGTTPIVDINWDVRITGGLVIGGRENSGGIDTFAPGEQQTVVLSLLGFGRSTLTATAQYGDTDPVQASATAYLIFFFIFLQPDESDLVRYEVIFDSVWSSQTHPDDFPPNPHFSGLIGATHNDQIKFWEINQLASPGIRSMAETGSKDPLNSEIDDAIETGTAFRKLSGGGIRVSPGSVSLTIQTNEEYPLVSLVSMIAPSPDWFVGVERLSLMENGTWIEEKIIELYPYDSGTDSGTTYTSPDDPTTPPVPIFAIDTNPFLYNGVIVPLGTFTFTKT
jgi:hypothetical protein